MSSVVVFDFDGEYEILDHFPLGVANKGHYIYVADRKLWYMNFRATIGKTSNLISFPTSINSGDAPSKYRAIISTLKLLGDIP